MRFFLNISYINGTHAHYNETANCLKYLKTHHLIRKYIHIHKSFNYIQFQTNKIAIIIIYKKRKERSAMVGFFFQAEEE